MCVPGAAVALTITVAQEDADNRPFEWIDDAGAPTGYHVDLVREVCGALGWEVRFERRPWRRVETEFAAGAYDAVTFMSRTPARDAFGIFLPGNILHRSVSHLYIRTARLAEIRWEPPLGAMMTRWRFGAVRGWEYNADFTATVAAGYPVDREANSIPALIRMLLADRIDVAVADMALLDQARRAMPELGDGIRPIPGPNWRSNPMYIAFTRNDRDAKLADEFAAAYAQWRRSPAYPALVSRYGVAEATTDAADEPP